MRNSDVSKVVPFYPWELAGLRGQWFASMQIRRPFHEVLGESAQVAQSSEDGAFFCIGELGDVPRVLRKAFLCPIGRVGNVIAVGETIYCNSRTGEYTFADGAPCPAIQQMSPHRRRSIGAKNMPKWAARYRLKIVRVWAQRLGEMSERDAAASRVERIEYGPFHLHGVPVHPRTSTYLDAFLEKWTVHVNPSWRPTDYVWALELAKVHGDSFGEVLLAGCDGASKT